MENTFKKLWVNELITIDMLDNKIQEIKDELSYYKKQVNNHNWDKTVVNNNLKAFDNMLQQAKAWRRDF